MRVESLSYDHICVEVGTKSCVFRKQNQSRFGTKDDPLAVDVVWNQPVVPVSQMTYEEWEAEQKAKQSARDSANNKGFEVIE